MNNWYGNNWGWNGGFGWGMNNWYGNRKQLGHEQLGWNGNYGWGMNFGFGLNNFGWNNWYGNNWYGNNWYPNNYNNREYSYNSSRRGSSNSNTADTNRSYNSTSRTFSNDRSSRAIHELSRDRVTLIGAQILSILEEVAIEKERTAPLIEVIQIKTNQLS
jgi:hypothetical protein